MNNTEALFNDHHNSKVFIKIIVSVVYVPAHNYSILLATYIVV